MIGNSAQVDVFHMVLNPFNTFPHLFAPIIAKSWMFCIQRGRSWEQCAVVPSYLPLENELHVLITCLATGTSAGCINDSYV